MLIDGVDNRLKEILIETAEDMEVDILSMEVTPDHVHLFISFDPRLMLHKVVKQLKGKSSNILRKEFHWLRSRIPTLWTRAYFSCSVSHISENAVSKYIEAQKKV